MPVTYSSCSPTSLVIRAKSLTLVPIADRLRRLLSPTSAARSRTSVRSRLMERADLRPSSLQDLQERNHLDQRAL